MYNIIKQYCENQSDNGLLLLDMPTGAGKTYNVLRYIFDAVQDPSNQRRFFFITTLKKNLPEEDLRRFFEEAGKLAQFSEKFLRVDSNYESVLSGFNAEIKRNIPAEIRKMDEYQKLESGVELVNSLRNDKRYEFRRALSAAEDTLRRQTEPRFRQMIQTMLKAKYKRVEDRLQAIKTEKNWQWVATLYPSVFMRDRQIIFMSVDKFLSLNSTIVEPPVMLYNSDLIEKAVIFIDEFDATKETVLKNIIENELRDKIDYVELFHAVYSALHTHSFPAVMTHPSKKRQEGQYKNRSLQDILDRTREISEEIYRSFSLEYTHRTERVTDENANNFLFQDHQYHSILDGNNSYITSVTRRSERVNAIRFSKKRPDNEEGNIQTMLGKLRGFISYFTGAVSILAANYRQCKAERRSPNEDEYTLEEAIRSMLSEFKLTDEYIDYLTSQILVASHKYKGDIQSVEFDLSFYEKGFRYYAFEDDYTHDMQSKIMMYCFRRTPEKMLLRFCEKAKVLGISATATIPSRTGNYDIEYLAEKLQDKYFRVTEEEKERVHEEFRQSIQNYDKVRIHTIMIGGSPYSAAAWKEAAEDDEVAQYLFEIVERVCSEDKDNYDKERYLRIAIAFKNFLLQENIRSFLCVLTRHPRIQDKHLDRDVLQEIFEVIVKFHGMAFNVRKNIVQLDGEEYDSKKDEIIRRLGRGEKLFVISVYQTIGAGQNLQYPIPADLRNTLVTVNDRPAGRCKDFDGIYLDKPTNLLVSLDVNMSEEDFVKYLFYVEMLQEAAEISGRDATALIRYAFRLYSTKRKNGKPPCNVNNCRSVILLSTRVIIQAIGRICRTNVKSPDIYVYADRRIAERVDPDICRGRVFNREFTELMKALRAEAAVQYGPVEQELKNQAELKSCRANKYIHGLLRESWTDNRIAAWKQLREMVLKFPTVSKDGSDQNGIVYNFYLDMPKENDRIYYTQEEDFDQVQVSFESRQGFMEESADAAKLTSLMRLDFLRNYFEKNGWATSFEQGERIMSPPLFNNIYRGALGEVVGKFLMEQLPGVELAEITANELFEKFDYVVKNSSVYVDFKNWHEGTYKESDLEIAHITDKARECGSRCVLIANILAKGDYRIRKQEHDGVEIVILPALLKEGEIPTMVPEAWDEIRRCIREYSNKNEPAGN